MENRRTENGTVASSPRHETDSLIPRLLSPYNQPLRLTVLDYLNIPFPLMLLNPFYFEIKRSHEGKQGILPFGSIVSLWADVSLFSCPSLPWMHSGLSFARDSCVPVSIAEAGAWTLYAGYACAETGHMPSHPCSYYLRGVSLKYEPPCWLLHACLLRPFCLNMRP